MKKRCKYSYALAIRSGNAGGFHSGKKHIRKKTSTQDWLQEWELDKIEVNNDE